MNRSSLLSALLTKRGVVVVLVASAGALGAGFGVLPMLLDGPADDGGPTAGTTQPTGTTTTATGAPAEDGDDGGAAAGDADGETTTGTAESPDETASERGDAEATPGGGSGDGSDADSRDDGGSDADGGSDDGTDAGRDDGGSDDSNSDDTTESDPEVGVQAETNATVSSRSAVPVSVSLSGLPDAEASAIRSAV